MTASRGSPTPRAADAAPRAFSTLKRDSPASVIGMSTTSTSGSGSLSASITHSQPSMTVVARPPSLSTSRRAGESGSRENTQGRARMLVRVASTRGSSALSTAQPSGRVIRETIALDLGELVDGVDAVQRRGGRRRRW